MRSLTLTRAACLALSAGLAMSAVESMAGAATPLERSSFPCWRMYTGKDGNTAVEQVRWPASPVQDMGSSHDIVHFFVQHAQSMIVVSGKPGWHSPMHNVGLGTEMVLVLRGSSIGHFANGKTQTFKAGDVVLIEDHGSKGRSVEFGPDGYLALTVTLDPAKS